MATFGGGIVFCTFCLYNYIFNRLKVLKTQRIMCLFFILSLISSWWKRPNLIQKGGSKYRVHQGYGCVWRRYPFCIFCIFCFCFRQKLPPKPRSCQKLEKTNFWIFLHWILNRNKLPPKPRSCQKLEENKFLNIFYIEFWIETSCHQNQDRAKSWKINFRILLKIEFCIETIYLIWIR